MAARKLGLRELPVVFLDHMTEEQRRAYILVDNQLTMNSGFDIEMLGEELDAITDIDMSQFDFDVRIDGLGTLSEDEEEGDEDTDGDTVVVKVVFDSQESYQKHEQSFSAMEADGALVKVG